MRARFLAILVPLVLGLAGCEGKSGRSSEVLTGRLMLNDQPVSHATVVASVGDKEASTPTAKDGTYTLYDPPKGTLRFKVYTIPPPPPGMPTPPSLPGQPVIPARYQSFDNELSFQYAGGKQVFDITLKP
ncbi:MAG TPA: hypothetical protein VMG10_23635 [Gemmataceae bacterium]|nr:hypothetical protein [Gemmataceae bacterium]